MASQSNRGSISSELSRNRDVSRRLDVLEAQLNALNGSFRQFNTHTYQPGANTSESHRHVIAPPIVPIAQQPVREANFRQSFLNAP